MDVHRKRSQVAIVDDAGNRQRNRNVGNDPTKLVPILGALAPDTPVAEGGGGSPGHGRAGGDREAAKIDGLVRQELRIDRGALLDQVPRRAHLPRPVHARGGHHPSVT
jgi:hypothetical protein